MHVDAFADLLDALSRHEADRAHDCSSYLVPRFIVEPGAGAGLVDVGNPYAFYRKLLGDIATLAEGRACESASRQPDENDVVYLSFTRTGAALNGRVGTALSQIAFLPHLRHLGVTVLLTLPTGRMGQANRKGSRGSPFAVANPFTVDPSLADPLVPDLDATRQWQALVTACTKVGILCGSIVPAATLALDSPLIARFPEITYWWDLPPGSPLYTATRTDAGPGAPDAAIGVDPNQTSRFAQAPTANSVKAVDVGDGWFWRSTDGLTPATSCPDVLADGSGTYSWADVAGLRFAEGLVPDPGPPDSHPTSRIRAVQIAALAIAWRAETLGEQIFWIDVAARIPPAVLDLANKLSQTWNERSEDMCQLLGSGEAKDRNRLELLLDEAIHAARQAPRVRRLIFIAEELYRFSSDEGLHSVVVGPWVFCVAPFTRDLPTLRTSICHHLDQLVEITSQAAGSARAIPSDGLAPALFLAGLGDHDTLPPDPTLAAGLLVFSWLLPRGVPMLFTGQESGSQLVINKEFGFNTTLALLDWRARLTDDVLPLFNDVPMPWARLEPAHDLDSVIREVLRIRRLLRDRKLDHLERLGEADSHPDVVGYSRTAPSGDGLAVYLNTHPTITYGVTIPTGWRLVSHSAGEAAAERSPTELIPFAAAVYAMAPLAIRLTQERS